MTHAKLQMASDPFGESPAEAPTAEELAVAEEKKREISSFMKDKMRREAESLGGNPNVASANPILIVSAVIGVLAILSFATGAINP